jgi:hypothetical protein
MDISSTIAIVGSILAVLMTINAFFIKSLVFSINSLNLKMTTITVQHDHTVIDVKDLKDRLASQEKETLKLRDRVHTIEGRDVQMMQFIDEQTRNK